MRFFHVRQASRVAVPWIAACLLLAAPLAAQEPEEVDQNQVVAEIFGKTKTAASADDFTGIIDAIAAAQKLDLSPENAAYFKSLLAWSYNRRGEAVIEQLAGASDQQQAAKLAAHALADFETSLQHDDTRWKTYVNRGVSYAQAGRLKEAEADMSTAVRLNPQYANAWFNRGEIYYQLGQYDKAIADYQQVLRLSPRDFDAVTSIGHAYFVQQEYDNAILWYDRALQLQPRNAAALANRGDAYHRKGQWQRAGADYLAAVALDENLGRVYQSGAWLWATCPIAEARNPAEAVKAAEKAIALDGDGNYQYLDTLAAAYARAGDFDKARTAIAQSIAKAPADEHDVLKMRQQLYAAGKPYEQFMFQEK
jgi:tetratricopeptide (TPR) repeat protein